MFKTVAALQKDLNNVTGFISLTVVRQHAGISNPEAPSLHFAIGAFKDMVIDHDWQVVRADRADGLYPYEYHSMIDGVKVFAISQNREVDLDDCLKQSEGSSL